MIRALLFLVVTTAACGDDGGPANIDASQSIDSPRSDAAIDAAIDAPPGTRRCGAMGSGTVTGTVMGEQIAPVVRAYQLTFAGQGTAIILDELGTGCTTPPTGGQHLNLIICALPAVQTYPVVGEQAFACPSANAFGLVEQNTGTDFAESTGGSVVVTDVSGGCTTGTFSINYLTEQLTGSFDAYVCP